MKRLLLVMLTVFAVGLTAVPASADSRVHAEGEWTYEPTIVGVEEVGPHLYLYGTDVGQWTGTLVGETHEDFVVIVHASGNNYYYGVMEFEGTVAGREGTLVIRASGVQIPGGLDPGTGGDWSGHWEIVSGTGELENAQGRGDFWGPSLDLDYSGKIHFLG